MTSVCCRSLPLMRLCTYSRLVASSATTSRAFCSDKPQYEYEITNDPSEWKYVERLLGQRIVPPPLDHSSYPTPSGWLPPDATKYRSLPYRVLRTKNHMLPVYLDQTIKNPRKFTRVKGIQGDIWALESDIKRHLEDKYPDRTPILTQVHEPGRWLRIRDVYMDDIAQFLIEQGF